MTFTATCVRGFGIGKTIGYPTINFYIPPSFLIRFGVYSCRLRVLQKSFSGILYYGPRALVEKKRITLEVHLLPSQKGVPETLSRVTRSSKITVYVGAFIREPREFKTLDALKKQISLDIIKLHT